MEDIPEIPSPDIFEAAGPIDRQTLIKYGTSWLLQNGVFDKTVINSMILSLYSVDTNIKQVEMAIDQEKKFALVTLWVGRRAIWFRKIPKILNAAQSVMRDFLSEAGFEAKIEWGYHKFYAKNNP